MMKLKDSLGIRERELVSIAGAGGKTALMFNLARELKALGSLVLVTTTTAIYRPGAEQYDNLYLLKGEEDITLIKPAGVSSINVIGDCTFNDNKLKGIDKRIVDNLYGSGKFDYILVEADGAKGKPIKAPAYYEPVIPGETTLTIGIIGMDSFGMEINGENVHRPEIFAGIAKKSLYEKIDEHAISSLVISSRGLFKNSPGRSRRFLFLNKAENEYRLNFAMRTAKLIIESGFMVEKIIIGSLMNGEITEVI